MAFSKRGDASFVDSDFIAGMRKKLELTQREAAEFRVLRQFLMGYSITHGVDASGKRSFSLTPTGS